MNRPLKQKMKEQNHQEMTSALSFFIFIAMMIFFISSSKAVPNNENDIKVSTNQITKEIKTVKLKEI